MTSRVAKSYYFTANLIKFYRLVKTWDQDHEKSQEILIIRESKISLQRKKKKSVENPYAKNKIRKEIERSPPKKCCDIADILLVFRSLSHVLWNPKRDFCKSNVVCKILCWHNSECHASETDRQAETVHNMRLYKKSSNILWCSEVLKEWGIRWGNINLPPHEVHNKKEIVKRFVLPNNTVLLAHYYKSFSGI